MLRPCGPEAAVTAWAEAMAEPQVPTPPQGRVYPPFSCQYRCPMQPGRMYCSVACYALDGFDLAGNDFT